MSYLPKWKVIPTKFRGKNPFRGKFIPGNPKKYTGNVNNIIFRSGMELKLHKYLDEHQSVVSWSSEEVVIPYISPLDGKVHRYFMDFKAEIKGKDGKIKTYLIEVKCKKEIMPPVMPKRKTSKYDRALRTFAVNLAKWQQAYRLCQQQTWNFVFMDEKQEILEYSKIFLTESK